LEWKGLIVRVLMEKPKMHEEAQVPPKPEEKQPAPVHNSDRPVLKFGFVAKAKTKGKRR
jgi:hypothetical protein